MVTVIAAGRTMMSALATAAVVGLAISVGGCRALTPPAQVRTIVKEAGVSVRMAHFEATRRGVYVAVDSDGHVRIAAEPPPDAALDITVDATTTLKAMLERVEIEGTLKAEVVEKIVSLTERTQAVVLMRDAMYRLAEMHVNGAINDETYREMYNKALAGAIALAASDAGVAETMLEYLLKEQLIRAVPEGRREQMLLEHLGNIQDTSDLLNLNTGVPNGSTAREEGH